MQFELPSVACLRLALCAFALPSAVVCARAQFPAPVLAAADGHIYSTNGGATDILGSSVALSGPTLVAGAPGHDPGAINAGGAWVFTRLGASVWIQDALLLASDGLADDSFGCAVAIDGATIVVGAFRDDHPGHGNAGSAYVFVNNAGLWTEQAKLVGSFVSVADAFGCSVAIEGDTIVVGSRADETGSGALQRGLAYVFTRSGTVWSEAAVLSATDGAAGDYFGESVSISGHTIAVGASRNDDFGNHSGSAYVFTRSGSSWAQQAKLLASDGSASDFFGTSIAVARDHVLVGAPGHDGAAGDTGAVYAFGRSGASWSEEAKLEPAANIGADAGTSVAIGPEFGLVGVPDANQPGSTGAGAAFLYRRTGSTWSLETKVVHDSMPPSVHFGSSVALSMETIAIGAPDESPWLFAGQGAAYAFQLTSAPQTYCVAKLNSLGCAPTIGSLGTPSASLTNPFLVNASYVINNKSGLLLYGYGLENDPFQGGTLCVQAPVLRSEALNSGGNPPPASCTGSFSYDFNARIQSGTDPLLVAGMDVYCQYWSRDPALGTAHPVSLSDALQFVIQP